MVFSSPFFIVFAGLAGLIIGSFLNVVIARLPIMMERRWRQECLATFPDAHIDAPDNTQFDLCLPASHCPECRHPIAWYDNIPVISWLVLKGHCRQCHTTISPRYPLVEITSAIVCMLPAWLIPSPLWAIAVMGASLTLLALTLIDWETLLLPDQLTLSLLWGGIALALTDVSPVSLTDSVMGAMAGYLSLWSLFWLFKLITGKEGMGYGDFKLFAALGAWVGWQVLPLLILLASLSGVVVGAFILRQQQKNLQHAFAFGPFIAIAGWLSLLWGDSLLSWYLSQILGVR
ncbi:prepilin peptidase [Salinivibrio sp. IB868]|uniref:prepilin peptidase n=1 Tax=unclassified Salinivibrio TaxID=2636825 RepID=UPI0009847987|nr:MULTISPECIES: A24 family peptidase [unclassified Salinivibrio]OOE66877.1 prepilin peptidase [Salinivibrio sp. IB868]OOE75749.1 prepilin peptidase [Salinivibrio sp. IB870]